MSPEEICRRKPGSGSHSAIEEAFDATREHHRASQNGSAYQDLKQWQLRAEQTELANRDSISSPKVAWHCFDLLAVAAAIFPSLFPQSHLLNQTLDPRLIIINVTNRASNWLLYDPVKNISRASDDRNNKHPHEFNETQLEAEICKQELVEAEAELRTQAVPVQQEWTEYFKKIRQQGFMSYDPADPEGFVERLLSFSERSKQVEILRAKLVRFRMREEWEKGRGLKQRLAFVRRWAPFWLRRRLVVRPRMAVAACMTRGVVRLIRKF